MVIVLFQPQIPQNAGNIVRTCSVTGTSLYLIRPLGFSVHDRWLKRAGLDYWEGVDVQIYDDLPTLLEQTENNFYFFSSKATKLYTEAKYKKGDFLIFGSETSGFPPEYFQKWPDRFVKIPQVPGKRCLNLATSAGIGIYEAIRQNGLEIN